MESDPDNPFDDIPDEIVSVIFKKAPLWTWKELSKVDKRFRRLVKLLKPEVTVIESFDLECMIDYCLTAKKKEKYDTWIDLFPYKLIELISNFPNVIGVMTNEVVERGIWKLGKAEWCWNYLGKNCPNLKFLFLRDEPYLELDINIAIEDDAKICLAYIEGVMEKHPDADPCCDQIIEINYKKEIKIVKKYPQLSFKLDVASTYQPFYFREPYIDRLVRVSTEYMDFDELDPMTKVEAISVDIHDLEDYHNNPDFKLERLELKRLKKKMSYLFPNLINVGFYTEWMTLTESLDLLDCESKIVKADFGEKYPVTDDHVLQMHRLATRPNSSLRLIDINYCGIYFANDAFIVKSRFIHRRNRVDEVKELFPSVPLPEVLPSTDEEIDDLINTWIRDVIDRSHHL